MLFKVVLGFGTIKSGVEYIIPKHTSYSVALIVILVMMCHVIRFHHINKTEFTDTVMEEVMTEIVTNVSSNCTGIKGIEQLLTEEGTKQEIWSDGEECE